MKWFLIYIYCSIGGLIFNYCAAKLNERWDKDNAVDPNPEPM
jgi:hypothetical protein